MASFNTKSGEKKHERAGIGKGDATSDTSVKTIAPNGLGEPSCLHEPILVLLPLPGCGPMMRWSSRMLDPIVDVENS